MIITGSSPNMNQRLLNHTKIDQILKENLKLDSTPRLGLNIGISKTKVPLAEPRDQKNPKTGPRTDPLNGFEYGTVENTTKAILKLVNNEMEYKIGIPDDDITEIAEGDAYITSDFAAKMNLAQGDEIWVGMKFNLFIELIVFSTNSQKKEARFDQDDFFFQFPLKIAGIVDSFSGRLPDDSAAAQNILISFETFNSLAKNSMLIRYRDYISQPMLDSISGTDFAELASQIIINFKNREDLYLNSNYNILLQAAVKVSAQVVELLGTYPIDIKLPLVESLEFTKFANTFISLIFNLLLLGLLFLASFVIYNIMLIIVDSKVYDSAVLRTIGATRGNLLGIMASFSTYLSSTAVLLGFAAAWAAFWYLNTNLLPSLGADFTLGFDTRNILLSSAIGFGIPLFSAVVPIFTLMRQNVAFALDKEHSKTSAIKVNIKTEGNNFDWGSFNTALVSIIVGVCIYFLLPLSLLSLNITLLVFIFFGLLGCMLVGLTILNLNFTYLIESLLLLPLLIERSFVSRIVRMNLVSHRLRNRRTIIIYSLALSFINFIYVTLLMQTETSQTFRLRSEGSALTIENEIGGGWIQVKNFKTIWEKAELQEKAQYSYRLDRLENLLARTDRFGLRTTTRGRVVDYRTMGVHSVSPNHLSIVQQDLISLREGLSEQSSLSPIEYMYTRWGDRSSVLSVAMRDNLGVSCENSGDGYLFEVKDSSKSYLDEFFCGNAAVSIPGFNFTARPTSVFSNIILPLPNLLQLVPGLDFQFDDLQVKKIYLDVKEEKYKSEVMDAIKELSSMEQIDIFEYEEFKSGFDTVNQIMNFLFAFITIITMSLSLFSLISTMSSNMLEQKKELAVMRCIGLSRFQIARIFLYESTIVILTGGAIGLIVGCTMGWAIVAQNALFSNSEFRLSFPWYLLITVGVFGLISSIFAAGLPAYKMLKTNISTLIKSI